MKKIRHALYIAVMCVAIVVMAAFAVACNSDPEPEDYTLTFMSGTVVYDTVTAPEGSEYTAPENPTREGHVFDGWALTAGGEVVELPAVMPSENRKYHAVFSARYVITLNAGIGSVSTSSITAKTGDNLYSLVSNIVPTVAAGSDAKFDGWYNNNVKLTANSTDQVGKANITLNAKYSVDYTVTMFKQTAYEGEDYEQQTETHTATGIVGDVIKNIPSFDGYQRNSSKGDSINKALSENKSENAFNLYYDLIGYPVIFNSNLPEGVEVTGDMPVVRCGYNVEYNVPACEFKADGYRFDHWTIVDNGKETVYRPGVDAQGNVNKYKVQRAQTFNAHWVSALTDNGGRSADRIYVLTDSTGNGKYAVLERPGYQDKTGTYSDTTKVFTFSNNNAVALRGVADSERGVYSYFATDASVKYTLNEIARVEDLTDTTNPKVVPHATANIELGDSGVAKYTDKNGVAHNGSYAFDGTQGSMKFVSEDWTFYFRASTDGTFMIRGDEYNTWAGLGQSGYVDYFNGVKYSMALDGYGGVVMTARGLNSTMTSVATADFKGYYVFTKGAGAYTGDLGTEIGVTIVNNSLYMRRFACLLMTGEYHNNATEPQTFKNVFLEQFATEIYAKPASGEQVDKDGDKIVLSGYSVLADSATYTSGGTTVKGTYEYDSSAGTLRITPATGKELLFEVRMSSSEEDAVPVFEPVEELYGQYMIIRLTDNNYSGYFVFQIYNNGIAAFAFYRTVSDSFYGNIALEYERTIVGKYEVTSKLDDKGNVTEDERYWEYEFSANITPELRAYMYAFYAYMTGGDVMLDIAQFGSFKFKFVYSAQDEHTVLGCTATTLGDFHGGTELEYDGNTYTLDGFGKATAEVEKADGTTEKVVKSYSYNNKIGLHLVTLKWTEDGKEQTQLFIDLYGDKNYIEYKNNYVIENSDMNLNYIVLKGDVGALALIYNSKFYVFSIGLDTIDAGGVYGSYSQTDTLSNNIFVGLHNQYHDFKYTIAERTDSKGNKYNVLCLFDVNSVNDQNQSVITYNGNTLTIDRANITATYTKADGESVTGKFNFFNDVITINVEATETVAAHRISLLLTRDEGGAIVKFEEVRSEVGYWISYADQVSYLYISGENTSVEKAYTATYYEYAGDDENGKATFTPHAGTYKPTDAEGLGNAFDFTYNEGYEVDEETQKPKPAFTFTLASDATGLRLFLTYSMKLDINVYMMNASVGQPVNVGKLEGGGFERQTLNIGGSSGRTYTGNLEEVDSSKGLWSFSVDNSDTVYYFVMLSMQGNPMPIMLDGTYSAPNFGKFEVENVKVTIPAHGDVAEREITVTGIETSGWLNAYVRYEGDVEDYDAAHPADPDDENESDNDPQYGLQCIYVAYSSNTYIMAYTDGADEDGSMPILFRFRLYVQTVVKDDPETPDVDETVLKYIAVLSDNDRMGLYRGDDLTAISLDGFSGAMYVDEYGVVYSGTFTKIGDTGITAIMYFSWSDFEMHYVFAENIDSEEYTYDAVASDDERLDEFWASLNQTQTPETPDQP